MNEKMPLGFERLNERSQRPNPCINFIKPLTTASPEDQKIAKNFLERIAAQCYPVMKKDYLSVMALEEYPPNPEFLGRNFNAGEVIQLVLKDKSGRWLSFKFVQMVMMHELAHCKQMNHSRYFWNERNRFAAHIEELWAAGYKGEGIWGRGQDLTSGVFVPDRLPDDVDVPPHLCGGTYCRGRGRKRKRGQADTDKPKLTYAERQQKRIAKKFGIHGDGQSLGEDDLVRGALERGKSSYGKPRVAQSKRGRELRANAALARFEAAKQQQKTAEQLTEDDQDSETESEDDEYADGLNILTTLRKIKDQKGRDMYRVCSDEGEENEGGQQEMDELRRMGADFGEGGKKEDRGSATVRKGGDGQSAEVGADSETELESEDEAGLSAPSPVDDLAPTKARPRVTGTTPRTNGHAIVDHDSSTEDEDEVVEHGTAPIEPAANDNLPEAASLTSAPPTPPATTVHRTTPPPAAPPLEEVTVNACPICSLENDPSSTTCMACAHVLKPSFMRNHWRCKSAQCKGSKYLNAGDAGRCGVCGGQKPVMDAAPMGVVSGSVLRWD